MSPEDLCKRNSESGHQKGLFAWAAMAQRHGFKVADDMTAYSKPGLMVAENVQGLATAFQLAWLHAIPNGGKRDPKTAALLKAEGVRKGVADVFLPFPRIYPNGKITYCGLYIEMKTTEGRQSPEQKEFEAHCNEMRYVYRVCRSWREAADVIKDYLQA